MVLADVSRGTRGVGGVHHGLHGAGNSRRDGADGLEHADVRCGGLAPHMEEYIRVLLEEDIS